jgi:undecaprenyl-diphosphatase
MLDQIIHIDQLLFDFINQSLSNTFFDALMPIIRNKKTWIPFYIIGALYLLYKYKINGLFIIVTAVLAIGMADGISSHLLKPYFERTRPCLLEGFSNHVNLLVERCSGAASFPSSHAANHFALAIFLSLIFYRKTKLLSCILILWAGLICLAQVYVGVHFPSDVIAGALLGLTIGSLLALVHNKFLSKNLLF